MQLDPPIRILTPLGPGRAFFMVDGLRGTEFGVFIDKTGELWFFRVPYIRLAPDITDGQAGAIAIAFSTK